MRKEKKAFSDEQSESEPTSSAAVISGRKLIDWIYCSMTYGTSAVQNAKKR